MVNEHDAVNIGSGQLVSFENSWPDGFILLSKLLLTMAVKRKAADGGRFIKFVDGAPRLASGVREVDGIDSFFPSLLLLIVEA